MEGLFPSIFHDERSELREKYGLGRKMFWDNFTEDAWGVVYFTPKSSSPSHPEGGGDTEKESIYST
jgi:hypothetical protein